MKQVGKFPVSAAYARIVARTLRLQERELPQLLAGTNLSTDILLPGDEMRLDGAELIQIITNGERLMGREGFGFAFGKQIGPDAHGPIGYLSLASPDVISSLRALANFLPARIGMGTLNLKMNDQWLDVTFSSSLVASGPIARMLSETFALAVQAQIEAILKREITEAVIEFMHRSPAYLPLYAQHLHGRCRFECKRVRYRLPIELAYVPNAGGDSEVFRIMQQRCAALLAERSLTAQQTSDRVRHILLEQPQGTVSEEDVARTLFVSKRTLARRLDREGTSYSAIKRQILCELATQALLNSDQSVESIAASLGYCDSAALRKAFRAWTGLSPSEFRRRSNV